MNANTLDPGHGIRRQQKMFLLAGLVLFIGTVITTMVATVEAFDIGQHGFDVADCILGLCIASVKATIVLLIFMHFNHEKRWIYFIAALATAHCAGMGMLLALSEGSKVHDPHFYQGVRQEDSGEFSMAKGKRAVTPARPPQVRLNPS
jgi:heme/copper-type cytochrome/quinol oxidase subunit 4